MKFFVLENFMKNFCHLQFNLDHCMWK